MSQKWMTTGSYTTRTDDIDCRDAQNNDDNTAVSAEIEGDCQRQKNRCEAAPLDLCPAGRCACSPRQLLREACCTGQSQLDPMYMTDPEYVQAYLSTVFDSKEITGTQIAAPVSFSTVADRFVAVYRNCNGCCTEQPTIDAGAQFQIETAKIIVKSGELGRTLTASDFPINNHTPSDGSVTATGRNSYTVPLSAYDGDIYKQLCEDRCLGSKDTVIIAPTGVAVSFIVEYVLCGYVTTTAGSYSFEITVSNTDAASTEATTTFYVPKLCVPEATGQNHAELKSSFYFEMTPIAPELAYDAATSSIILRDTMIVSPTAIVETVEDRKMWVASAKIRECR